MRPVSLPLASVVFAALALASSLPVHATGPCVPSVNTLCLDDVAGDKRFAVKVDYSTTQGGGFVGSGKAVPLNALGVVRGGLFYFFNADNPEILVKIVNGCALNNRFWVYLSAGTNVGFNLTVTDTTYDKSKSYQNPDLLAAQSVNDTASVTCDGSTPPTDPPPTEPPPGDPRWILTTRPGTFFTATAQNPVFQVDIPVSPAIAFYRVVVEVEVDLNGWYEARPTGKHNIFKVWRGSSLDGNLFGDVGILGPSRNELELVSNADLPSGQYEVQSDSLELDPNGTYSFLYIYTSSTGDTETAVYEGSVVGQNRIFRMFGSATAHNPIHGTGQGFSVSFGYPDQGAGNTDVPSLGWTYKNMKAYLEYPVP